MGVQLRFVGAPDTHASPRPDAALIVGPIEADPELRTIAQEVTRALGSRGTIITIQDGDEEHPDIIGFDASASLDDELVERLAELDAFTFKENGREERRWKRVVIDDTAVDVLLMPVERVAGHRRTVVSAVFDSLDAKARQEAEEICHHRRSVMTAYFKLWQTDRTRRGREAALETALSAIRTGVVLVDSRANIVFANDAARGTFRTGDCLKMHRQRLQATNLKDNVRLTVALEHVVGLVETAGQGRRAPMLAMERPGRSSVILLVLPLDVAAREPGDPAAVLYIVDPAADYTDHVRPLCRIYRLSRVETDLACLLARGMTLAHAAEEMRIKEQTARSCLRSIFIKTRTGRQIDLVLLMLSSIVPISGSVTVEPL